MKVTIEKHVGVSVGALRRETTFAQYRIRVDGVHAGFIGWAPGSRACLTRRFSPIELAEIELQLTALVGLGNCSGVAQAPLIPATAQTDDDNEIIDDEFDEFDT